MSERFVEAVRLPASIRRRWIMSLVLTLCALLLGLQFVVRTTGGTLFAFSVAAPLLVAAAIGIFAWTVVAEFRRAHRLFEIRRFPEGEIIFRQGDPGDCAYFIRAGRVQVVDDDTGGVVKILGQGDYFGEIALVTNRPRTATIRTASQVEVAMVGKDNFLNMMRLLPTTEEEILRTVQRRVMEGNGRG